MPIDLATVLSEGERFRRSGGVPTGENDAELFDIMASLLDAALQDSSTIQWTFNNTLNQYVAEVQPNDDETFATPSTSEVPSTRAVYEFVQANMGGGGGGDVDSTSTTVAPGGNYWDFVLNENDFISNSATKLPTQASTRAYIDSRSTLQSSDSDILSIDEIGGVVVLNVDNIAASLGTEFSETLFRLTRSGGTARKVAFSLSSLASDSTTRTITVPDASGTLDYIDVAQTFTKLKTFTKGIYIPGPDGNNDYPYRMLAIGADLSYVDYSAMLFIAGSATYNPAIQFLYHGAAHSATPTAHAASANLMQFQARGRSGSAYATFNQIRVRAWATEAGGTGWGSAFSLYTTAAGGSANAEEFRLYEDKGLILQHALAVGAGTGMANPRTGVDLDMAGTGAFSMSRSTITMSDSDKNDWDLGNAMFVEIDATGLTATRTVYGILAPAAGTSPLRILNFTMSTTASRDINFAHNGTGGASAAANQISINNEIAATLNSNAGTGGGGGGTIMLFYSTTQSKWRILAVRA